MIDDAIVFFVGYSKEMKGERPLLVCLACIYHHPVCVYVCVCARARVFCACVRAVYNVKQVLSARDDM